MQQKGPGDAANSFTNLTVCFPVQAENNLWKKVLTAKEKLLQFYFFIYKNTQTLKTQGD